jgi:hypothetical protein
MRFLEEQLAELDEAIAAQIGGGVPGIVGS